MRYPFLWQSLSEQAQVLQNSSLRQLFNDPLRANQFSLSVGDLFLDYSKNFINERALASLIELAKMYEVEDKIQAMFTGKFINATEQRPALHTALRRSSREPLMVEGVNVMASIASQQAKMAELVQKLQQKAWLGATGKAITDVVNLGIGGSDLGPKMAVMALQNYQTSSLNLHFVSNVDPLAITSTLAKLNPATTIFIISSKSFTTPETLTNARLAEKWLKNNLKVMNVKSHFIAVTANTEKAVDFGIDPRQVLSFEQWVGGRYSVWSTIGLPLALLIGMEHFNAFLAGARLMDEHFKSAPLNANMPVILALLGIWYIHGWQAPTMAVLPYAHGLREFPAYLQQLDMESNGKRVTLNGEGVTYSTGPIVWGQAGTDGQHAFYQLLHQGTHFVPIDFIVSAQSESSLKEQHLEFVANVLAQAQALMEGTQESSLLPHEMMSGNKPSNLLLIKKLTPHSLGQLLALYEHKVYVQGIIWEINSFDQPGVELGKKLAKKLLAALTEGQIEPTLDGSTMQLINKIKELND